MCDLVAALDVGDPRDGRGYVAIPPILQPEGLSRSF